MANDDGSLAERAPQARLDDHAAIDRLADELVPALVAKLGANGLGELEVREGTWRVRLRMPADGPVAAGRRTTAGRGSSRATDAPRGEHERMIGPNQLGQPTEKLLGLVGLIRLRRGHRAEHQRGEVFGVLGQQIGRRLERNRRLLLLQRHHALGKTHERTMRRNRERLINQPPRMIDVFFQQRDERQPRQRRALLHFLHREQQALFVLRARLERQTLSEIRLAEIEMDAIHARLFVQRQQ